MQYLGLGDVINDLLFFLKVDKEVINWFFCKDLIKFFNVDNGGIDVFVGYDHIDKDNDGHFDVNEIMAQGKGLEDEKVSCGIGHN